MPSTQNWEAGGVWTLGDFYRLGEVVVLDPEQAALWYRRAADQGHPEAALRLGWMYAPRGVIDVVARIRCPFNVNAAAQAADDNSAI